MGTGPAERLLAAFEMHEEGMEMFRLRLRREHPDASPHDIEAMVAKWLADRPLDWPTRDD